MKTIACVISLIALTGALLAGCERRAAPSATPGPLPTPRVAVETVLTDTPAPTPTAAPTAAPATTEPPTPAAPPPSPTPRPPTATFAPADPADLAAIAVIDQGKPRLVNAGKLLPFYRAERELRSYQTEAWTYFVDAQTHVIVEILPVYETATDSGTPLDPAALEQAARDLIAKAAPGTQLDGLRVGHSSQTSNFLFRWEDHRARVMDDRVTYPYIQVALSASGQLLNYFNTLVFSE